MPDLDRFLAPQAETYAMALSEIRRGRKESHWMWWIFPQLASLGRSGTAQAYGIADLAEAQAYLAHPVLGPRLVEVAGAMMTHAGQDAGEIMGAVDGMKLRSCATLFASTEGAPPEFRAILDGFYGGVPDPRTEAALAPA